MAIEPSGPTIPVRIRRSHFNCGRELVELVGVDWRGEGGGDDFGEALRNALAQCPAIGERAHRLREVAYRRETLDWYRAGDAHYLRTPEPFWYLTLHFAEGEPVEFQCMSFPADPPAVAPTAAHVPQHEAAIV